MKAQVRLILPIAFAGIFAFSSTAQAQNGTNPNYVPELEQQQNTNQQLEQRTLDQNQTKQNPPAPKVDPKEEAAYKAFYDSNPNDADTRIKLGEDFVQKYPTSRYAESVYAALTHVYFMKQDWKNFNASADKALALNPNDPSVLIIVGWVIPHSIKADDPNALSNLDKAEKYEKHAIEVLGALPKPEGLTDEQFTQNKTALLSQAHSGLGLVYFRRQQFDDSVKELQQATQASAPPDPTDLFVLGIDLQNLNRYADAVDAFNRCAQISGGLQDRCKQSADAAKKQVR